MKNYVKGVEPDGGRLVFKVSSQSRVRVVHTVDLEAYRYNGACDCERFQLNLEPFLRKGAYPKRQLQCKHIRAAREWLLNECINQLVGHFNTARAND